jgi:hypothetical protein
VLGDAFEIAYLYAGTSTTSNLTSNTGAPSGTTASIVSFTLPGSATPLAPGPTPVNVTDPGTGKLAGALTVLPNGTFVFTAEADYSGKLTVVYTVGSSDGQRVNTTLELNVIPGLARCMGWCVLLHNRTHTHARTHTMTQKQAFSRPK